MMKYNLRVNLPLKEYLEFVNKKFEFVEQSCEIIIQHPDLIRGIIEYDRFKRLIQSKNNKKELILRILCNSGNDDSFFINLKTQTMSRENFNLLMDIFDMYTDHNTRINFMTVLAGLSGKYNYPNLKYYVNELIVTNTDRSFLVRISDANASEKYYIRCLIITILDNCGIDTLKLFMDYFEIDNIVDWNNILYELLLTNSRREVLDYIINLPEFIPNKSYLHCVIGYNDKDLYEKWRDKLDSEITPEDFNEEIIHVTIEELEKYLNALNMTLEDLDKNFMLNHILYSTNVGFQFVDRGLVNINDTYDNKSLIQYVFEFEDDFQYETIREIVERIVAHPTYRLKEEDIPYLEKVKSILVNNILKKR